MNSYMKMLRFISPPNSWIVVQLLVELFSQIKNAWYASEWTQKLEDKKAKKKKKKKKLKNLTAQAVLL